MAAFNIFEYVFPVVVGEQNKPPAGPVVLKQIYGTAFSIGDDWFLTAGHLIKEVRIHPWFGIAYPHGEGTKVTPILDSEIVDGSDIGIFTAKPPYSKPFGWTSGKMPMASAVQTTGFPYAMDLEHSAISVRSFVGNIVSAGPCFRLTDKPDAYELSFQCPRGLSGAPLCTSMTNDPRIVGVIVGNSSTEMLVYTDKEITRETDTPQETIIERYESLQLGIAVQGNYLFGIESRIMNGSETVEKVQIQHFRNFWM